MVYGTLGVADPVLAQGGAGHHNGGMKRRPARVWAVLAITLLSGISCSAGSARTNGTVTATDAADAEINSLLTASDAPLAAGERRRFLVNTHCGVAVLSRSINGVMWRTDEATGPGDWTPAAWMQHRKPGDQLLTVEIEISEKNDRVTASYAGRSVQYRPMTEKEPKFACA